MKKILSMFCLFLLFTTCIFANDKVERTVKKIREEFTKTNSEKKYTVKTIPGEGDFYTEFYIKDKKVKKIVFFHMSVMQDNHQEYYIKDNKLYFLFLTTKTYSLDEHGNNIKKPTVEEKRYYFDRNEELIRYIGPNKKIFDKGSIPTKYIEEAEMYKENMVDFLETEGI